MKYIINTEQTFTESFISFDKEVLIDEDKLKKYNKAAQIIQQAWKVYVNKRIFFYYKRFINHKCVGNPRDILRLVNPREANLVDSASGIHVRFRLGGVKFPPYVYYKIYTHRPIQDMCSNSPKDYALETEQTNKKSHTDLATTLPDVSDKKFHWYRRRENNSWRMLSDKLFLEYSAKDEIRNIPTRHKKFCFDRVQRRKEAQQKKKLRKIQWMTQLYTNGGLEARKGSSDELRRMVKVATEGIFTTIDEKGGHVVEDWEVDELLKWTNSLNFEEYHNEWHHLATSRPSALQVTK